RLVGGKQFFESTKGIPGVEEGVVRLEGYPKNPWIVGSKQFFRRTESYNPGEGTV
ncbi:hypothetical protein A2U01_0106552, partial [Trifolium medium]|nr:hypothetical protein [Trifolium medium]